MSKTTLLLVVFFVAHSFITAIAEELTPTVLEDDVLYLKKIRTWTSASGAQLAEARLKTIFPDKVALEKADGGIVTVPLSKLSENNRAFVKKVGGVKMPPIYFNVGDNGQMRIGYTSPLVHILNDHPKEYLGFFFDIYKESGEVQESTGGFYKVNGKPTEFRFVSNDKNIVEVKKREAPAGTRWDFTFKSEGRTSICVRFGDLFVIMPVTVESLPLKKGDTVEEIIERIGLPDSKDIKYTSWPDAKSHEGIIYAPTASDRIIAASHWEYEKYPLCVLSIVDGKLYNIGIKNMLPISAESSALTRWLEHTGPLAQLYPPKKSEVKPRPEPTHREPEDRTWADKTGKFSVAAKFIKLKNSQVHLERKDNGKTIEVPMSRLSKANQEWIRDELKRRLKEKRKAAAKK